MNKLIAASCTLVLAGSAALAGPLPDRWPMLGGDAEHSGLASTGPGGFEPLRFATPLTDLRGRNVALMGNSSVVVAEGRIYAAVGSPGDFGSYVDCEVLAFDERTGAIQWHAPVGDAQYDSWSSPAIDTDTSTVVFGNGSDAQGRGVVYGLDAATGTVRWQATLDRPVLNASAVVGEKVAYITDHDFFARGAKLYAINLDPAHPTHDAGEVLWSQPIGNSAGNTPALHEGKVYVASGAARPGGAAPPGHFAGGLYGFDVQDGTLLDEVYPDTDYGFWGGVAFSDGCLYASTYNFAGDGELWKIDLDSGDAVWSAPAASTDSMVVVDGDRVLLDGGIALFGQPQRLQCFDDETGGLLWETDPDEHIGFWNYQLAAEDGKVAVVRVDPATGQSIELLLVDASVDPADPAFLLDAYPLVGTSPALANSGLYTGGVDADGVYRLFAFGDFQVIPEPATVALLAAGCLALRRRRR
ncbi:MAG: PQQ-binding-like beta-propeller repeat protein [Candidatus Brocadiia bacterium]